MRIKKIILLSLTVLLPIFAQAQEETPSVSITVTYQMNGETKEATSSFAEQAPLVATLRSNPQNMAGYSPIYEWHFKKQGADTDLLVRYEEDTEYTFTDAGVYQVTIIAKQNDDGTEIASSSIDITIKDSKLTFPNAFSPNDDIYNKEFRAKEYQSLVEFHAYIFNRWGQKLYEWTDPAGAWDGTYNGQPVKEGTYYLLCKARGADGIIYNIRKDVNLLRGFTQKDQ